MTTSQPAPIRAIAWDIDGTLIDSEPLHEDVLAEVCAELGTDISDIDPERFRGLHLPDVWLALQDRLPDGLEPLAWQDAIIARYVDRAGELTALPGALDVMERFAAAGLPQVCVSNSGRRVVDANIRALGIGGLIAFSLSLDDVAAGKPDPEPYAAAARRLGLAPSEMAAVEDSLAGATSALRAGLQVFAIAAPGAPLPPAQAVVWRLDELLPLVLAPPAPRTGAGAAGERMSHGL